MRTWIYQKRQFPSKGLFASSHLQAPRLRHRRRFHHRQTPSGFLSLSLFTKPLFNLIGLWGFFFSFQRSNFLSLIHLSTLIPGIKYHIPKLLIGKFNRIV